MNNKFCFKKSSSVIGAAVISMVSMGGGMANAQDGEQSRTRGLEEIVVSARRMQESLQDTPISVVAVTGEDLDNMGIANLDTLDAFVPNVSTGTGMGNSGWASFSIRGIGGGQGWVYQESGVGVYIDDIYYPRANGALLDVVDVAQIEILRGPQGTLFGRNTTGGAIRYMTTKPDQEFAGSIKGVIGNYERRDINAAVNIPLTEQLAARVTYASKKRDGFIKNLSTGVYAGNSDVEAARVQLRWQNDTVDWNLAVDTLETSNNGVARDISIINPGDIFVGGSPDYTRDFLTSDPFTVAGGPIPDRNSVESWGVTNTVEVTLSENLVLKSLTGFRKNEAYGYSDWDLSPVQVYDAEKLTDFDNWSQEFQLNASLLDDRLDLVLGAYYMNETAEHGETTFSTVFPPNNGRFRAYNIDTTTVATFAQGSFDITEALRATVGVRWSEDDKDIEVNHSGIGQESDKWSSVTTRFGLDYKITDDVMVYASAAEGFKAGGFNQSAAPGIENKPYDPEELWTYEVGMRSEFMDNRVRFNATYFFTDYKDIHVSQVQFPIINGAPVATQVTANAAAAEMEGIEIETVFALTENFTLHASGAWIDAKYTELDAGVAITKDTPFQRTPEYSYTVGAAYTTQVSNGGNVDFNVDYGWKDEQSNTDSSTGFFYMPSYGLLNARLGYEEPNGRWSVALVGTNLLDEEYLLGGFDPTTRERVFGFKQDDYGRPREYGVELSVKF